jgi:predicted  nucleic acid-binding Zn-ribbon protein
MTYESPKISREEAREKGLKRFFTGEPCKQGHISERQVSSGECIECARERSRIKATDKIKGGKYAPKYDPKAIVYGPFISRELAKEKGYKQFYDGIPCMHGHYSRKAVINKACFTCTELKRTPSPLLKLTCKECGKEFFHKRKNTIYCSRECSIKNWREDPKNQDAIQSHREKEKETRDNVATYAKRKEKESLNPVMKAKRKETAKKANKKWELANKDKRRGYVMKYYNENPQYRLAFNMRVLVRSAVKRGQTVKRGHTSKLIGCTSPQLVEHLQNNFEDGMNWDNYRIDGWHVDHIRPCASFDLTDEEQQIVCFNWRNLRPMWAAENISKSDNYDPADEVDWAFMMRELGHEGELFLLFEEGNGGL